ncbi:MAG: sulfur carrier protein ThiS [Chromatiaceae bacterium]|nr:MAG: sulfur carrier protein ThiS [Chromatiaceae bacterium]
MHITINGAPTEIPEDLPMTDLIARLNLTGRRLAVEVNQELVPRGQFDGHRLRPGDRVEIIHAVGGG